MPIFEVTARGFVGDGSTDTRVLWVEAPQACDVSAAIQPAQTGAVLWGEVRSVSAVPDFELPRDAKPLFNALSRFK